MDSGFLSFLLKCKRSWQHHHLTLYPGYKSFFPVARSESLALKAFPDNVSGQIAKKYTKKYKTVISAQPNKIGK